MATLIILLAPDVISKGYTLRLKSKLEVYQPSLRTEVQFRIISNSTGLRGSRIPSACRAISKSEFSLATDEIT